MLFRIKNFRTTPRKKYENKPWIHRNKDVQQKNRKTSCLSLISSWWLTVGLLASLVNVNQSSFLFHVLFWAKSVRRELFWLYSQSCDVYGTTKLLLAYEFLIGVPLCISIEPLHCCGSGPIVGGSGSYLLFTLRPNLRRNKDLDCHDNKQLSWRVKEQQKMPFSIILKLKGLCREN